MLLANPSHITIESRQREIFDEQPLQELIDSIDEIGLIHPPVVRYFQGNFVLVAGERRLRACKALLDLGKRIRHGDVLCEPNTVPFLNLGNLTDLEAAIAEFDENIRRKDLTWQERAKAEAFLHNLRSQQNEGRQTLTATATEIVQRTSATKAPALGNQITAIGTRINLAKHLDDPEVAKAKTEAEAVKVVRKKQETARIQGLSKAFEAAYKGDSPHQLLEGDFRSILPSIHSGTVDILLTDPPYGIAADTFGEQSGTGHNYADSEEYFQSIITPLAEESYRVCRDQAHAYVFCDPRRFLDLSLAFSLAGWEVWPIPLIWDKGNGMLPRAEHAPRRTYEAILYAIKGKKTVRMVKPDVIRIPGVRDLKHGAQKPVDLYVDLLSRSATPGDTILDAFAGSGTIFPAANRTKTKAIGIELTPENVNIARLRMDGEEDAIPGLEELL